MRAFRNIVAYMGFGFYWAWIFVSFNSVGSLGQNLSIDALTSSHLASSVAAILPLLAAFLLRGKIEALPRFRQHACRRFSLSRLCMRPRRLRRACLLSALCWHGALCMARSMPKMRLSAPLFRSRLQGLFISPHRLCRGPSPLWLQRHCPSLPDLAHARAFPEARIALSVGKAAFPKSLLLIRPSPSEPWLGLRW